MSRFIGSCIVFVAACMLVSGCTTAPKTEAERTDLVSKADQAIARAKENDASLKPFFDTKSVGYAVFPTVGKGGAGIGGAYGKGILYEGGRPVGYCDLSQASIGLQLGGQSYTELIFFETAQALSDFKESRFEFSAQATAVAVRSGAGGNAKYENGVAVFTMDEAGLMAEASVGGQKFTYVAMANATQPTSAPAVP
jgi:lipid-binding SYLF domain-containing protein